MADVTPIEDAPRRRSPEPEPEPLWREVLGDHLRELRQDRDQTLVETARRAGISPQYLSEIERGLKEPSSEMIAAVAGALGSGLVDLTSEISRDLARRVHSTAGQRRVTLALAA
jgi:transcriptional regulator with XRE-family HTH domain